MMGSNVDTAQVRFCISMTAILLSTNHRPQSRVSRSNAAIHLQPVQHSMSLYYRVCNNRAAHLTLSPAYLKASIMMRLPNLGKTSELSYLCRRSEWFQLESSHRKPTTSTSGRNHIQSKTPCCFFSRVLQVM